MNHFKDVKVGDRVWSMEFGWGVVEDADSSNSFGVRFPSLRPANYYSYERDTGRRSVGNSSGIRTLFWDEVAIVPPARPRRRVCKTVEGWMKYDYGTLFSLGGNLRNNTSNLFPTKDSCERKTGKFDSPACKVRFEWYEEEE